jgi:hypothetical protein
MSKSLAVIEWQGRGAVSILGDALDRCREDLEGFSPRHGLPSLARVTSDAPFVATCPEHAVKRKVILVRLS